MTPPLGSGSLDLPSRHHEERFERIAELARRVTGLDTAVLAFVEEGRVWIKSGPGVGASERPLGDSLYGRILAGGAALAVSDLARDERFADTEEARRLGPGPLLAAMVRGPRDTPVGVLAVHGGPGPEPRLDAARWLEDAALLVEGAVTREALEQWRRAVRELGASRRYGNEGPDWLFEHSLDLMVIASIDGYFKQVSPSWTRTLGWTEAELLSRPYTDFVHPDDVQRTVEERERLGEGSDTLVFQNRYRHRDGSYRWLHWKAHTSFERNLVLAVARDITDSKSAEIDLRRAKEAAEAASLAKSNFLAAMSHELRTPLNSILGFTRVLLRSGSREFGEVERDYLRRVQASGRHLLDLVNKVLDLGRVETGRLVLEPEPVDVAWVVTEVTRQLEHLEPDKGVTLSCEAPAGLERIVTDAGRLRQILFNLIGNALKFTERGSVRVVLEADPSGTHAGRVRVIDTGPGIPPDRLEDIFAPFEQVEAGTARRHDGAGLGLAIARSLAEILGFRLSVESRLGAGSTFTLELQPRGI